MTDALATPAWPVIDYKTVSARLDISPASKVITLDGVVIGTFGAEMDDGSRVWTACLTDVLGHRGGIVQHRIPTDAIRLTTNKVVDILRRHFPDVDHGPISLDATEGEMNEIRSGARTALHIPYNSAKHSRTACRPGRKARISIFSAPKGRKRPVDAEIVSVRKVTRAEALAANRLLEFRHPSVKAFAEVTFTLVPPADAHQQQSPEDAMSAKAAPAPSKPRETQATIMAWKRETFGPSRPMRTMARAAEEAAELFRAITSDAAPEKIVEEAADTALILADIGELLRLNDWLFMTRAPMIRRPAKLAGYVLTHLGTLSGELDAYTDGDGVSDTLAHTTACALLRAVIGGLEELCGCYGHSLRDAIDAKMAVNRTRKWNPDGTGHGYHRGAA
ncbi:hypothetical protein [Azospirillum sp. B2RO_4]|uniref:hypothetical protein n=1 Tax=Azospirillum sp. B2RO_4 TaxID=3027796 RepID=UPI003DA8378E